MKQTSGKIAVERKNLRVEIKEQVSDFDAELTVAVYPVDLPPVQRNTEWLAAWGLKVNKKALAARLERALLSGKIIDAVTIKTDVNGKTYYEPCFKNFLLGRRLSADLMRLGF